MILERAEAELHLTLQPNHRAAPFNVAHMMVDNAGALLKPTGLLRRKPTTGKLLRAP